jgi:hypothetical protein
MTAIPSASDSRPRRGLRRPRRAIVAVVVLLMIAVALATSYSAMRSQTVTLNVRQNAALGVSAQRAALTGLAAGFREMHSADWSGTGTVFSRALAANESFEVAYIAGDATLTAADPDYDEHPFRVTLSVIGTASDPLDARRVSRHSIRAVARLIPRSMPDEPSDWSEMQSYTFYQTDVRETTLDLPCRIQGRIRLQGRLRLGQHYPDDWNAWRTYFFHQNQMCLNGGYEDIRTLTGRVYFPYGAQDWYVRDMLSSMSVSTSDRAVDLPSADWSKPAFFTSYRIFPGGPAYTIPRIPGSLQNETLAPDVIDNPLGLFYADTNVTLGDNVTVRGTLFCRESVRVDGTNVRLDPVDLPPLWGSSLPIRLPVATCRDFEVEAESACVISGLLAAFDSIDVANAWSRGQLTVTGRVIADDLDIREDERWRSVDWWKRYDDYLRFGSSATYFPVWMRLIGYHYAPTVEIKEGETVQYHWYRPGAAIFVPHPNDFSEADPDERPGLRWELIEIGNEAD